ncbi:SDR family oxidoreductase [Streptomyces corynorhini]|uniref:SDR family NAD(P)-dependent oxidoreductase n=1 Tax=Streptomyces corynorhini TaxID=2282652 RepID=A0A370B4N2_9ACTN|nr:SDR family oxidoreductase [Streptomyces corynorhini]RDG36797.1 SDR family NAD(P)-dependent oxidoreductase [Streptomyces corynorhini]
MTTTHPVVGALEGRTAVITGAARGAGRACALAFAAQGADLVLLDVAAPIPGVPYPMGSRSQLDHTADSCRRLGADVLVAAVDVRDLAALTELRERTHDRFGAPHVLVNNAGIVAPSGRPVHETAEADWQLMVDVDLGGAWRATKVFVPAMVERRAGTIINIASTAGLVGYRNFAGYVAAKHGLIGLTKASALDYASYGVRVNAVCPGNIRDEPAMDGRMLSEVARALDIPQAGHDELFTADQPMNTLVDPADVAAAALWLACDASRRVTGTTLTVDAGYAAR